MEEGRASHLVDDVRAYFSKKHYNAPMPQAIFFHYGFAIHGTMTSRHSADRPRMAASGCIRPMPRPCSRWSSAAGRTTPPSRFPTEVVISGPVAPDFNRPITLLRIDEI
jgi:hypothetical protein